MSTRIPVLLQAAALAALVALPLTASTPAQTGKDAADVDDNIALATVDRDPVTARDVVALFNKRHAGHAKFLGGEVEARRFLDIVIDDRLLVQEAYALGIGELPEVQKYVDAFARAEMSKYFVSAQITEAVKVTPEEVKAVWESSISTWVHARHIVVASRAEAEQVRAALVAGTDFETLARVCSLSESRKRGGNIMTGWGQYGPEWERVVFALQEGEISPVIENAGLFEIVQVTQRIDVQRPELKDVEKKLEEALFQRKFEARKIEVSDQLMAKYDARILVKDYSARLLRSLLDTAPKTVVATWNGGELELDEVFDANELQPLLGQDPISAKKALEDELRQTLNAPLVALEAKALRYDEVPTVAKEIERYSDYVVESVLFRDHIFRSVDLEEEALKKYFEANSAEFVNAEQRRVAQVLVPTKAEADKVRAEAVAADADFAALAKKYSRDMVSSASGGDLGWITADKVPDAFKEVLGAKPGAVLQPVQSASGWHVIKLLEIKPKSMPALEEVKEKVRERALEAKKKELRAFWVAKLRKASEIRIDDAAIAAFVKANESVGPPPQHGMQ